MHLGVRKNLVDYHTHYTGSLPIDFIWQKVVNDSSHLNLDRRIWDKILPETDYGRFRELDDAGKNDLFPLFRQGIERAFAHAPEKNLSLFAQVYSFFQTITKPAQIDTSSQSYRDGTYAIAREFYRHGVSRFELLAGPTVELQRTVQRLLGMIDGLERFELAHKLPPKNRLRLTFIRATDGCFKNLSGQILSDLFCLFDKDHRIANRISGFDFSGYESPLKSTAISEAVTEIADHNRHRCMKGEPAYSVSVHAGENLFDHTPADHLAFFNNLINLPIQRIGHGTFLWIPETLISLGNYENKERERLLLAFQESGCMFEICPTANLLLTPLSSYSNIPLKMFAEIRLRYSINTDNPTIFSTTLAKEYQHLGLAMK